MKLEPCPFCGVDKFRIITEAKNFLDQYPMKIQCLNAGCEAEGPYIYPDNPEFADSDLAKKWNERK